MRAETTEIQNYCLQEDKYFNVCHFVSYDSKIKTVICFVALMRLTSSVLTKEQTAFYVFPNLLLLLNWCTVCFMKHLSALPSLSPSSRVPAGKSAARQKWVRNMKTYKCKFHEAPCSYYAIYFLATKTLQVLSFSTPCCASHPSSNYSQRPAVKPW